MEGMTEKEGKKIIKTHQDLNVFKLSYELAVDLFKLTKTFPKEEMYSLVDQIRRASRSIPANIGEGWAKRKYENVFLRHLNDAHGSCVEIKIWLDFARDCQYIGIKEYDRITKSYNILGAMLGSLMKNWKTYNQKA